jgi:DNA-binding transcriptional MocR family regulator
MTSAEKRRFIRLWTQEASCREIAQALGCALGTVASRASVLVRQGKIQPRPRGGAYSRQQGLTHLSPDGTPASPATPAPPAAERKEI